MNETKKPDDNELLQRGELNPDMEAGTEPVRLPDEAGTVELPKLLGSFVGDASARMRRRASGKERPLPVKWWNVREAIGGGLWPGTLSVLAGGTGTGKTVFALETALAAAQEGTPVLYVSLELGADEMVARLLGLLARRKWSDLYRGKDLEPDELETVLRDHGPTLSNLPFRLEVGGPYGWDPDRFYDVATRLKEETGGPFLVVLDYLQLVGRDPREELRHAIQRAAYQARAVARDLDAAVLLLSSVARGSYHELEKDAGKGNPGRFVGVGKESGEVEFAADLVLALAREGWDDDEKPPETTRVHVAVAKNRTGPLDWCALDFNGGWFTEPRREKRTPLPRS